MTIITMADEAQAHKRACPFGAGDSGGLCLGNGCAAWVPTWYVKPGDNREGAKVHQSNVMGSCVRLFPEQLIAEFTEEQMAREVDSG